MEWLALVLLCFSCVGAGLQWSARCQLQPAGLTLGPAGLVPARYTVQWCSREAANARVIKWSLVAFVEAGGSTRCHGNDTLRQRHSRFDEVVNQQYNCDEEEQVCFSAELDLLYSGCYVMQSRALLAGPSTATAEADPKSVTTPVFTTMMEQAFLINDSLLYGEIYNQATPLCKVLYGDPIVVHWYLGHIPVTEYTIELEKETDGSSEVIPVTAQNCSTPRMYELRCSLPLGLSVGRYQLRLEHDAPWTRGESLPPTLKILRTELDYAVPLSSVARARAPYWAAAGCGVAGAGAAALLVLLAARRHRALASILKRVCEPRYNNVPEGGAGSDSTTPKQQKRRVVLLYARDCAPLMQAAAELRALLQLKTEVFDLHSPETIAALAPAPAAWLRAALAPPVPAADVPAASLPAAQGPDTVVVLLETPAAAMLYGTAVGPDGNVVAPLLGRRVLQSPPAPGDALLTVALQQLRETVPSHRQHRHLYIATVDVSTPLLPHTQRYRRYPLPGGAARLLQDACGLAPAELPACGLARLRAACDLARQHARDRPDYLRDHLLFL